MAIIWRSRRSRTIPCILQSLWLGRQIFSITHNWRWRHGPVNLWTRWTVRQAILHQLNYLPGTNKFLDEFARRYGLPFEATRGGAETMYPEYQLKLKDMPIAPPLPKKKPAQ